MKFTSWGHRLHRWIFTYIIFPFLYFIQTRIGMKSYLMMAAVIVGLLVGSAAILLRYVVHIFPLIAVYLRENDWLAGLLLLPGVGILCAFAIQKIFVKGPYEKSLSKLIYNTSIGRVVIGWSQTFVHILSSGITVGMGGSAGLEAPIVLTGAAIGSRASSCFRVLHEQRSLLIACGAASGIAGLYDAPVAGAIFAAEVILPRFTITALIPALLSTASALVITKWAFNAPHIFLLITSGWSTEVLPYYAIFGVLCGLIGAYIIKVVYTLGNWLKITYPNQGLRMLFGIVTLGVIIFFLPMLYGEGYSSIRLLFSGEAEKIIADSPLYGLYSDPTHLVLVLCILAVVAKVYAAVITVECGGEGGIFTPSIFTGAFLGFSFARVINAMGWGQIPEHNFIATGMCGVFVGVIRAPLTGVFLIAEITGGYVLLTPLMIVAALAFFVARYFEPWGVYTRALAEHNLIPEGDRYRSI